MAQSDFTKEVESKLNGQSRSIKHAAENIGERLEKFSHEAGKTIGGLASSVSDSTSEYAESSRSYIRQKPLQATAMAAAAGLAAGCLITILARRK